VSEGSHEPIERTQQVTVEPANLVMITQ
jgi:hypothetical protein